MIKSRLLIALAVFTTTLLHSQISTKYVTPTWRIPIDSLEDRENEVGSAGMYWVTNISKANRKLCDVHVNVSSALEKYPMQNIQDKNFQTVWVEGRKDSGVGEWIKYEITLKNEYRNTDESLVLRWFTLFGGHGKSQYYAKNNRIKVLRAEIKYNNKMYTVHYKLDDVQKVQSYIFKHSDVRFALNKKIPKIEITFYIEEIYKGSKWDDTCITEMKISGIYE
jgi:hypothetical protein